MRTLPCRSAISSMREATTYGGGKTFVASPCFVSSSRRSSACASSASRASPGLADRGDRLVPEVEEPLRRLEPRKAITGAQSAAAPGEVFGRDRVLEKRAQARDDCDRGLRAREPPERKQPLVHRAARGSTGLERHRLALRERENAVLAEPAGELGTPSPGAVLAWRDEGHGPGVDRHQRGPREGAAPGGGVGDRHTPSVREPRREVPVALASSGEGQKPAESRARR